MIVLGLHGGVTIGQHEPGAALIVDGRIVAACEEERYLRIKSAYGYLPYHSIRACLRMANIRWEDIDLVVTPGSTYGDFEARIRDYLRHSFGSCPRLERVHHQMAHLATTFYGSGLEESLVLSLDATGDGACAMMAHATRDGGIRVIEELPTNRSLGFFYTLMTYYLGFADGDEYKVMGLAAYGSPDIDLERIIRPVPGGWDFDWSFVRPDPFPRSPFEPSYAAKVADALGWPNRTPGGPMPQFYKDVARSTQAVFEECLLSLVRGLKERAPPSRNLCFAGGTALNCSGNRRLLYSDEFDHIYVPPAASDRGLAIGCAYLGAVMLGDRPWRLASPYLGSSYSDDEIRAELTANGIPFEETDDPAGAGARLLAEGRIVGWYQGRSEAGARALGNRSIIARCDSAAMRDTVNARIKYREEFRPFAPSVLSEEAGTLFDTRGRDMPYMCFTVDVDHAARDQISAVVHVDGTARVQTVRSSDNEIYYDLIARYRDLTGTPAIMNTSFNLKGQPIVETPRDAVMTFFGCGLDALVLGGFVVRKPA
jgi:carbamoyltransferase